jgi:DNA-binding GntR family transcriptional regulator
MLAALERELLRTLVWPDEDTLGRLKSVNAEMSALVEAPEWIEIVELNREFHSLLWSLSTENLICSEVQRIWSLADAYMVRAYSSTAHRRTSVDYHEKIIAAISGHDHGALQEISDAHRDSTFGTAQPNFV